MAVSYKRLWKLLVDKEMSKSDLRKKAEIAPNTMTKLRRDEVRSMLPERCTDLVIQKQLLLRHLLPRKNFQRYGLI